MRVTIPSTDAIAGLQAPLIFRHLLSYTGTVRRAAILLMAVLVTVAGARPARADDPVIHVRSRMRLDIDAIERVSDGVVVRGFLRDEAGDEPIGGRTVAISLEGPAGFFHYAEPTRSDGSFSFRAPVPLGQYRLRLGAGGDPDYVAPPAIERPLDVAKRTPTLTLTVPARLPASAHALHVIIEGREPADCPGDATCPAMPLGGEVDISVGGRKRSSASFHDGRVEVDELGPLGDPGRRVEVLAEVEENNIRNAASARRTVLLTSSTSLTLEAAASEVAVDGEAGFGGTLRDERGPVAGARIGIAVENGPDLATAITDGEGRYRVTLRARKLPRGDAFVEARFHPSDEWREPSCRPPWRCASSAPGRCRAGPTSSHRCARCSSAACGWRRATVAGGVGSSSACAAGACPSCRRRPA